MRIYKFRKYLIDTIAISSQDFSTVSVREKVQAIDDNWCRENPYSNASCSTPPFDHMSGTQPAHR
jgi:hypothetical protein